MSSYTDGLSSKFLKLLGTKFCAEPETSRFLTYQCISVQLELIMSISVQLEAIRAHYVVFGLEANRLIDPKCNIGLEIHILFDPKCTFGLEIHLLFYPKCTF